MREIKFRAWDKKSKQLFLSPSEIRHLGSWFDAHLLGGLACEEDVVIMQFTGLKDKNGIEIYEGDIARDKYGTIGKIIYTERWAGFAFYTEKISSDHFCQLDQGRFGFEVIGNIYENPELLK